MYVLQRKSTDMRSGPWRELDFRKQDQIRIKLSQGQPGGFNGHCHSCKTYKPRCVSHIVVLNVTINSIMLTAINSITANIESKVLHHTVVVLTWIASLTIKRTPKTGTSKFLQLKIVNDILELLPNLMLKWFLLLILTGISSFE